MLRFAQISDCHLYRDKTALHFGVNVYQNLCRVLEQIKRTPAIELIVFTGDLTQDHSISSYQNFTDAINETDFTLPVYFVAGNHDEPKLLQQYLSGTPFHSAKVINKNQWQIQLLASKSTTPSGEVSANELARLLNCVDSHKFQFIFMHHHPVDVGYFIDKHGLLNKNTFYQTLNKLEAVKAVACGHVHNALALKIDITERVIPLFTCPATSIQFDQNATRVENSGKPAGFRIFELADDGQVNSQVVFID
ncbi:metallophosphoesterase [Thalassotalea castellviae]|uniref:Metallophosphoesterase n=1 Tax=Thalassotalea castellviae TaxID=3075612 RepID=A0ABU3A0C6_9GAMM|nr:metallophosphoesterase [Thalassotalea sp. W431]MDT0603624.1 metallophosphoesterase [Thalassotalea sp. W431]